MKAAAAIVREVFQTLLEDRDTNCDLCNAYLNHFLNCSASRQMSWSTLTDLFR
jgi:predicted nucleic acid-binding Zn ribbon protein